MKKIKVLCFFGTRPEAIKMAPVISELKKTSRFQVLVGVSAQHRTLLDQVLGLFKLNVNFDLNIMKESQSIFDTTARVLSLFENVLEKYSPDLVLVHGDTTTTLAGALAAFYKKIPVGHVEAGLRSHHLYQPFPEEMNRRLTDELATLYFAPTAQPRQFLINEGLAKDNIFVTGNTVIDALIRVKNQIHSINDKKVKRIGNACLKSGQDLILLTAHRRENFGKPFQQIFTTVRQLSLRFPDAHWIYPVHPNPNVTKPAKKILGSRRNIHLVPSLSYHDLVAVLKKCKLVVTDSGGLQEEAPSLGKPVLVLRNVTERPEAVKAGTVQLVGSDPAKIKRSFSKLMTSRPAYQKVARAINPYGDGKAAIRIRQGIEWYFGMRRKKPRDFK